MIKKKHIKKKKSNKMSIWPVILLFIIGLGIMLYPALSDTWNQYRNSQLIQNYGNVTRKIDKSQRNSMWNQAVEYNKNHRVNTSADAFDNYTDTPEHKLYENLLNPTDNGIMGTLTIPKIKENIVIYHGLGEEALEKGCGHMEGTSLPVGQHGENGSHAVLAAHRGLPSAKLFTDLNMLKKGDKFFIAVLDKHLAYQVDQIKTEVPEKAAKYIFLEPDKDYVTLVTCTPYGVNSHRLLIRGHRIPYEDKKMEEAAAKVDRDLKKKIFMYGVLISVIIVSVIALTSKDRKKHDKEI